MKEIEKKDSGLLFDPMDPEIQKIQKASMELLYEYNNTSPSESSKRKDLLKKMLKHAGKDCYIEPPFHANWGGHYLSVGDGFYANFNFAIVDDVEITIGDHVFIGPNVTISTAEHPLDVEQRIAGLQYNLPVVIEDNVWIGASSTILAGVHIGENSVIGAGSLVTHDIPENCLAYGIPAKVQRKL